MGPASWIASRLIQLRRVDPAVAHRLALGIGCTSAIAWGQATSDGQLLHARNFDYHGVGCWPRTAAVVFHEPDRGLRYVSIAAAGILLGGVTAMNEAGLTLTVHQHMFTDGTRFGGTAIGCVGDIVMREASNLDEAEAILRAYQPIGCWTYLIADGRRNELLCWEENPDRATARRYGEHESTFGYANIFFDRQLGDTEHDLYGSYWRANLGRQQRINQLLAADEGQLSPDKLARFLADPGQGPCRISTAIGMVMTVGSVVFRPADGAFWVATGQAPTSQNPFIPFELPGQRHAPELGRLHGGRVADPQVAEAFECYRQAYLAYLDEGDVDKSRALVDRACELAPDQPLYHVLAGLLALRLHDYHAGLASFDQAVRLGHQHAQRRAAFRLWRGRAADLLGQRQRALRDYRAAMGQRHDRPVGQAARRGLRRPYRPTRAKRIDIDFAYADVVSP